MAVNFRVAERLNVTAQTNGLPDRQETLMQLVYRRIWTAIPYGEADKGVTEIVTPGCNLTKLSSEAAW